jgi:hypothetical protein
MTSLNAGLVSVLCHSPTVRDPWLSASSQSFIIFHEIPIDVNELNSVHGQTVRHFWRCCCFGDVGVYIATPVVQTDSLIYMERALAMLYAKILSHLNFANRSWTYTQRRYEFCSVWRLQKFSSRAMFQVFQLYLSEIEYYHLNVAKIL